MEQGGNSTGGREGARLGGDAGTRNGRARRPNPACAAAGNDRGLRRGRCRSVPMPFPLPPRLADGFGRTALPYPADAHWRPARNSPRLVVPPLPRLQPGHSACAPAFPARRHHCSRTALPPQAVPAVALATECLRSARNQRLPGPRRAPATVQALPVELRRRARQASGAGRRRRRPSSAACRPAPPDGAKP
jgi:hypothetical protein